MYLLCNGQNSHGTAGAVDDFERCGDYDSTCGGELVEVHEAGEAEATGTVHEGVAGEGRIEATGLSGIGANGLYANAENVALLREVL